MNCVSVQVVRTIARIRIGFDKISTQTKERGPVFAKNLIASKNIVNAITMG